MLDRHIISLLAMCGIIGAAAPSARAQTTKSDQGPQIELVAAEFDALTRVPPPPVARTAKKTASFVVTYHGFSDEAKTAFQAAVDIWATLITSPVSIQVDATWEPLGSGVLGSAGPTLVERDFAGAPLPNTFYAVAAANRLAGQDLEPSIGDIRSRFNSDFSNWYFGTDGNTPIGQFDLMSVVMHELGHGLGFLGSMKRDSSGIGSWGLGMPLQPIVYDRQTQNLAGQQLIDTMLFPNPSAVLGAQLVSDNLFFAGPQAVSAAGGARAKIYAPASWKPGSSYSHLDEATYPAGNPNSLMTPMLGRAEAIHSPGPIGLGVLQDAGWK